MIGDVGVTRNARGSSVGAWRVVGHEDGKYQLALHPALAVMPYRGGWA